MRLLHWLHAKINGYWWEKCWSCGYAFGGHEAVDFETTTDTGWRKGICCPKCLAEM